MSAPVDRRLVRASHAARGHLIAAGALGAIDAGLIVAQAVLLATVIARAAEQGAGVASLRAELLGLGGVLLLRSLVSTAFELSGRIGASRVMTELRHRLVAHVLLIAPGIRRHDVRTGELATDAVQGVDALEAYFAGYLPQLMLASVVPVVVLGWVATVDPISAVILAITVPILILFMVLVGKGTRAHAHKRLDALELLGAHFLDVVRGLPTLRAYRRERVQEQVLGDVGDRYRRETMNTLRIAFLSALVLELCAMLGTAVVAATIGVQLVDGDLTLAAGLTVLLLAPELYGPLRQVGQQFHASADGHAAADRILGTLERPPEVVRTPHPRRAPDPRSRGIALCDVSHEYPGRAGLALNTVSIELPPGSFTALVGESGSGKSTVARLLTRLADPTSGTVRCGGVDLRDVDVEAWRAQVAWVPQNATLFTGTVAENLKLSVPDATPARLAAAINAAGLGEVIEALPHGLETVIGESGRRLSAGQRQRIAVARALLRDAPLLILDEPTSHLDPDSANAIGKAIDQLARDRTTLLIAHHPRLAARADRLVRLDRGRIVADSWSTERAAA